MAVAVSNTDDVALKLLLVTLLKRALVTEDSISIVVVGMLLVVLGAMLVEELIKELEDDNLHFPDSLISAFLGTTSTVAGRVNVHSLRSLMFLTPSKESLK